MQSSACECHQHTHGQQDHRAPAAEMDNPQAADSGAPTTEMDASTDGRTTGTTRGGRMADHPRWK